MLKRGWVEKSPSRSPSSGVQGFVAHHDVTHSSCTEGSSAERHWQHTRHAGEKVFSDLLANPPPPSWQPWHLRRGWKLTVLIKWMNKSLVKLNRRWAYEFCWLAAHLWVKVSRTFFKTAFLRACVLFLNFLTEVTGLLFPILMKQVIC